MAMVILGAGGGLGKALTNALTAEYPEETIVTVSRQALEAPGERIQRIQVKDYSEDALNTLVDDFQSQGLKLTGLISTIGMLHDDDTFPEKKLGDLSEANLRKLFDVNAIQPILALKSFRSVLDRKHTTFWVQLSAKVGSIEDNYLGGWYAYRASKAALNMLLKTASIELKRTHKRLVVAAIHPGTTDTALSKPFQSRIPDEKLYTPELSAKRILKVINEIQPEDTGKLWHWDGTELPY
ncbi:SDR family NAD(P)-dependent oxidoreductase [Idiomarina piscisalsi]|uniref:SDR family NAD(P)-dependent oxidoreductase n=1 Tax=Idiomarina piscisalsi TaxID=1096243 RepID=UPI00137E0DFC|nr:SDR family NAD(P)-dependent oxidoreductase [Idiomarina piscisalsi]MTJ00923.1 SDR family NAD(P)-dependent oxidoreductase [Idiomarina piscisalsi]